MVIRNLEQIPLTLMTARAADLLKRMLDRGFTTVRDTGGADWGLKEGVDKGLIPGPVSSSPARRSGPRAGTPTAAVARNSRSAAIAATR